MTTALLPFWAPADSGQILKQFESLDADSQTVGHAIAWLMEPLSMTALFKQLVEAGIRTSDDRRFTNQDVKKALDRLAKAGLTKPTPAGGRVEMENLISHYLAANAATDPERVQELTRMPLFDLPGRNSLYRYSYFPSEEMLYRLLRHLRWACYTNSQETALSTHRELERLFPDEQIWSFLLHPFQQDLLVQLPKELYLEARAYCLRTAIKELSPLAEMLRFALETAVDPADWRKVAELALFRADWATLDHSISHLDNLEDNVEARVVLWEVQGARAFLEGDDENAIAAFEESITLWRKQTRKRKACPEGTFGVWFLCALLRRGRPEDVDAVRQYAKWSEDLHPEGSVLAEILMHLALTVSGQTAPDFVEYIRYHSEGWLANASPGFYDLWFFTAARLQLRGSLKAAKCVEALERLMAVAQQSGAQWVAAEAASLRDEWSGSSRKETAQFWKPFGPQASAFTTALKAPEPWEKSILALETLGRERAAKGSSPGKPGKTKDPARKQLIWNLRANDYGWSLVPIERSISAGGKLSKGRNVALKRLKEKSAEIRHLTDQDRAVASYIKEVRGWSYSTSFELRNPKALLELAGHPLIFADAEGTKPLELVKEQPHVSLQESKAGTIRVQLSPKADYNTTGLELIRESSTRYLILQVTETVVRLANALGGLKAEFPSGLRDRVTKAIGSLAGDVLIESDHLDLTSEQAETLPADAVPIFRLYPHGEGLHVRLLVRPLPSVETVHAPGEGKAVLFAMLDGKPVRAQRDLKAEKSAAMKLLEACPTFAESRGENGEPWAALLESPRDCLNLLAELHELNQEQELVRAEWPEGQSFQLRAVADGSQFHLSLGGSTDWLTATGELKMNDELVLSMRQLLDLMESSSPHPGFLQLEDGQFLALTTKFQRQLEDLRSFSQPGKGDAVKIHPLAALAMEDLTETPNAKIGAAWKKQLKRLRESSSAKPPHPPSTLQAELRPYQLEGYRWLRRLADWGMGACLADDMGLGKTVQTLALLLDRAKDGPALVVAPTSVAANWLEETMRFAPALSPILYGRNGENREEVLADLGPFDLLIVSYGLLQFDSEAISQISWHTAILDEAQAIKNRATKRSQAVMKLKADFRLVTTGTPVENRLAELHNLFNFTNPGLLGSWDRFRTTFADPIERQEDEKARERLRRLIRPFMLRRLKSAVLQDLPSRTEIGLQVELSPEEAAFYEALRQKAVEELESASQEAEPGQVAIRILSQLTRLRRACCHPKLVDPGTSLGGSKLSVFSDTLEEILAGNHKVLVFSQFVDHLQIVRQHLEAQKISYQYLDGSSPAAKRQQAVRDFQSGIGDVFLISLKAGGFGLNLTAADYVIHMDPWWNPAAEDQASDRAHRIGQTRPVTVYRLITTGTIEEKILNLHHRKRELADSILEGTDSAGRITPEDMLELLRS